MEAHQEKKISGWLGLLAIWLFEREKQASGFQTKTLEAEIKHG